MTALAVPSAAPGAPVASGGVRRLRQVTLALLWAFTFTVPSSAGFVAAPSLGTISRLVGGLAMAAGVAALVAGGRWHRLTDAHRLMLALAAWTWVSMLWSIAPALTGIVRWTTVQLVVLAVLVWEFARDRRQWHRLYWAYVLGAYVGSAGIAHAALTGAAYGTGRFAAAGFNPGTQAHVLLLAIPLAAHLALTSRAEARTVAWAYLPIGSLAVLLTASRAALLILPVALAAAPLCRRARQRQHGEPVTPSLALVAGTVLSLATVLAVLPPETAERLGTLQSELTEGSLSGRAELWAVSAASIGENELLGVGAGGSRRVLQDAVGAPKGTHNAFLAVTTDLGVVGLALLALLLIAAGERAHRLRPADRALALTLLAVIVLGMVPSHSHAEKSVWLALAFVLAPTRDVPASRTPRGAVATPAANGWRSP